MTPEEIGQRHTALPHPARVAFDRTAERWFRHHDDYTRARARPDDHHGALLDQMFRGGAMSGIEWALYAVLGFDPATEMPIYDEDPLRTYLKSRASDRSDRGTDV